MDKRFESVHRGVGVDKGLTNPKLQRITGEDAKERRWRGGSKLYGDAAGLGK